MLDGTVWTGTLPQVYGTHVARLLGASISLNHPFEGPCSPLATFHVRSTHLTQLSDHIGLPRHRTQQVIFFRCWWPLTCVVRVRLRLRLVSRE